jgi:hypothetical protein
MEREDYLARQLRDFARVLARILGLRDAGAVSEALEECERAIASASGLDPRLVRRFRASDVLAFMRLGGDIDPRVVAHLAALLDAEGDLLERDGRPGEAAASRGQAAELLRLMAHRP